MQIHLPGTLADNGFRYISVNLGIEYQLGAIGPGKIGAIAPLIINGYVIVKAS